MGNVHPEWDKYCRRTVLKVRHSAYMFSLSTTTARCQAGWMLRDLLGPQSRFDEEKAKTRVQVASSKRGRPDSSQPQSLPPLRRLCDPYT